MAKVIFMCRHYRNTFELPDDMKVSDAIGKFTHNPCTENVRWTIDGVPVCDGVPLMDMTLAECATSYRAIFINKICEPIYDEATGRSRIYCSMMKV